MYLINRFLMLFLKMSAVFIRKKTNVFTGEDSSIELMRYIVSKGRKRVYIITTQGINRRGQLESMIAELSSSGIAYTVYDQVNADPTFEDVRAILETNKAFQCDAVLAVGGGSVMDAAKAVALSIGNNKDPEKLVGMLKGKKRPLPLYCVPTTSGTGSEATVAAVISDTDSHQKQFVIDIRLVSDACALDPVILSSVPPGITAMTGMDALTHAIEAYIGINGSKRTDKLAEEAILSIVKSLPVAYKNGNDLEARSEMAMASYQAGVAFTEASLGYVHAISHQLGAHYGVPHGLGNAILLPKVLLASLPAIENKLARLSLLLGWNDENESKSFNAMAFIRKIEEMNKAMDIPGVVYDLDRTNIPSIAKSARKEAVFNYPAPKLLTVGECEEILEACLA